MKAAMLCVLLAATLAGAPAIQARQQTVTSAPRAGVGEWAAVNVVPRGEELIVKLRDGRKVKGRLQEVSDDGAVLSRGGRR